MLIYTQLGCAASWAYYY